MCSTPKSRCLTSQSPETKQIQKSSPIAWLQIRRLQAAPRMLVQLRQLASQLSLLCICTSTVSVMLLNPCWLTVSQKCTYIYYLMSPIEVSPTSQLLECETIDRRQFIKSLEFCQLNLQYAYPHASKHTISEQQQILNQLANQTWCRLIRWTNIIASA